MISRASQRQLSTGGSSSSWDRSIQAHQAAGELLDREFSLAGLVVGPVSQSQRLTAPRQWHWLGPRNLGGRTRTLVVDPRDPRKMWAGSVSGGLWCSDNGGDSWQLDTRLIASLPVSCLSMDLDTGGLFAGTGELVGTDRDPELGSALGKRLGIRGAGIYRQASPRWERIPGTENESFEFVNRLAFARLSTASVLLAATHAGLFRIVNPQGAMPQIRKADVGHNGPIADVEFHPADPNKAVAGGFEETDESHSEAYYTENGGADWKQAEHTGWVWKDRVELAYAHADPTVAYCSANAWRLQDDEKTSKSRIFVSQDGGHTYLARSSRLNEDNGGSEPVDHLAARGDYANTLWASDPHDSLLLVVGGTNLFRSTDGGESLTQISMDPGAMKLETLTDFHVLATRPDENRSGSISVLSGSDGGIWIADDIRKVETNLGGTNSWKPRNTGYGTIEFYGAAGNPRTGTIVGGAQDLGVLTRPLAATAGADSWSLVSDGDGGLCAADHQDSMSDRFYYCLDSLTPHRVTISNGQSRKAEIPINGPGDKEGNFIVPLLLDPGHAERLLVGGVQLWQTNNARAPVSDQDPRWSSIKEPLKDVPPRNVPVPISAIAIDGRNADTLWVGHNNGCIFRTSDGTKEKPQWYAEEIDRAVRGYYCTQIVLDPREPEQVYVLFGGYHSDNLWVKRKGDKGWKSLPIVPAATLQPASQGQSIKPLEAPLRCLTFHPDRNDFLYLGTEIGLYCSADAGASWMPINEGPAQVPVDGLFWMNKTLVAVTHGRGLYSVDLAHPENKPLFGRVVGH